MTNRDYHAIIRHLRNKAADSGVSPEESQALTAKANELAAKYNIKEVQSKLRSNANYGKDRAVWIYTQTAGGFVYSDYRMSSAQWLDDITEDPFRYDDPDWGETVDWWGN